MAGEITFKTAQAPAPETASKGVESKVNPNSPKTTITDVEVPYLDTEGATGYPHTVEYFGLGDTWNDPMGGFPIEVRIIEGYFKDKIESGEIANSKKAVDNRIKEILKITNMDKEERAVLRVNTVSEYIKFLTGTDRIKQSLRHGNT